MADTLLILEDEVLFANEVARHYRLQGWEAVVFGDLAGAERALLGEGLEPLVVLSDMSLPDGSALDLLERIRDRGVTGEWILLTAYGSVPDSVRALRLGAYDFLEKPCPTERLDLVVRGAARSARAQRRLREQARNANRRWSPEAFVGSSPAAAAVREILTTLASVPFTALVLTGETGTGKGLAARILHSSGPRSEGPLVEVNCAALPQELLESELFGHEPGAFTGATGRHRGLLEQAHGGTLFLDEIADLGPPLQAKLLKAIEDRRVRRVGGERELGIDAQVIAATNHDLGRRVEEGSFREDLFHRLSVFRIELPPLSERIDDLDDLVPLFIGEFNAKAGRQVRVVPPEAWQTLRRHRWPGNVRELRNAIERCVLLATDERLAVRWLQLPGQTPAEPVTEGNFVRLPLDGSMALDDMERHILIEALERTSYNVSATARSLGTTRQTLRYRIRKHKIQVPD